MRRTRVPLVQMSLLFLLAFAVLSLPGVADNLGIRPVYAATTYTVNSSWCSGAGYSWDSGTSTCTLTASYTINSGDTLEIPSGTNLTISGSTTYIWAYGTIYNDGDVTINSGTIKACFEIANHGNIVNFHGYIGGSIACAGEVDNYATGVFYNYGMINSYGADKIGIRSWGTIYNYGSIYNPAPVEMDFFGPLYNYDRGAGIRNGFGGTMELDNVYNYGYIETDSPYLTIGTLYNYGPGLVDILDMLHFSGVIYNYGAFNANSNIVDNGGTFYNECGGVIGGYTEYTQLTCYSVTFQQTGMPTSGVTWGVTVSGTDHTGTGASIVVAGLSGTVSYTFDSPVSPTPTGVQYACLTGCSGLVTETTTVSATYGTQYPSAVPEFPAFGPLLLVVLLFPALLVATRRFRETSA